MYGIMWSRIFRIMDDDGSKKLDYQEFKKGVHDYGLVVDDDVSCYSNIYYFSVHVISSHLTSQVFPSC